MGLAGAAVADGDDVLSAFDVLTPGQLHDQWFVHRGDGEEVEGVQAFYSGEACRTDPTLHHALVAVDEFQFGEAEQVVGMAYAFSSALASQLAVLSEEGGQLEFLEVVLQQQRGLVAHAARPDSRVM